MSSHSIEITFSNNVDTYYAGQIVEGTVVLETTKPKEMNCITVQMKGECLVKWTTTRSRNGKSETVTHTETELYFKEKFVMWGTGSSQVLPVGRYSYNFAYKLPSQIPSSFEGNYGYVRYTCSVKAEKAAYFSFNWVQTRPFSVITLVDLNGLPQLMEPECITRNKTVGVIFNRGDIHCQWTLPRKGFVCGEIIPINLIVDNGSSKKLTSLGVSLTQTKVYKANASQKEEKSTISNDQYIIVCKSNTKEVFDSTVVKIPPLPPSELIYCRLINITYKIKVVVGIPGLHRDIKLKSEITIGSIPFRNAFSSFNFPPPLHSAPSYVGGGAITPSYAGISAPIPTAPSFPLDNYAEMPPPSYMEAMMMGEPVFGEEDKKEEQQPFAPRYPVFVIEDRAGVYALPPPYPGA